MGKKNKGSGTLGRALIKDRFGSSKGKKMVADNSMLHTTEVQDGYDWGRLNLQSVTEESSFQEFLATAELTGAEFQAEKLNIKFVNPKSNVGLLNKAEMKKAKDMHDQNRGLLKIPRRPPWNTEMSREELDQNEKVYFLEWRRSLAQLQEDDKMLLTPYEKNLEFWRQLWRVVERSDVVVQIVDARNPLLFRCEDLEQYVKEVSADKINMILVNKADFLTEQQRQFWSDYFTSINVYVIFYSAVLASEENDETPETALNNETSETGDKNETSETEDENEHEDRSVLETIKESVENLDKAVEKAAERLSEITVKLNLTGEARYFNSKDILTRDQLIELFRNVHKGTKVTENITTIGLVGYPNVGKSSTINSLMLAKKVSVSATPGKTKHFQTLFLDKDILLCDCPGLVMPSFVFTKAEMVINGILPVDQMRDHVPPVNLICHLIPRHVVEDKYGIMLPLPVEGEDPDRCPTSEELLNAYAYNRGFMTANGQPDNPRAARYVLKDYLTGKLIYCHAPPTENQVEYHTWPERQKLKNLDTMAPPRQVRAVRSSHATTEDVDKMFFHGAKQGIHIKGKPIGIPNNSGPQIPGDKPWKQINKHGNKNKKEKLRRVYAHLDQH